MVGEIRFGAGAEQVLRNYLINDKKVTDKTEQDKELPKLRVAADAAGDANGEVTEAEAKAYVVAMEKLAAQIVTPPVTAPVEPPVIPFIDLGKIDVAAVAKINNMKSIPGGSFVMGTTEVEKAKLTKLGVNLYEEESWGVNSEIPHNVAITGFEMAATETTQAEFELLMGYNPANFKGANKPVEKVDWFEANEFALRKSFALLNGTLTADQKTKLTAWAETAKKGRDSEEYRTAMVEYAKYASSAEGKGLYRLPTESEWEYAARGGKQNLYGTVDGTLSPETAVYNLQTGTADVGSKKANPFGLSDMSGNVWEWCNDWYGGLSADDTKDPKGAESGNSRVLRGGGWRNFDYDTRSAIRYDYYPGNRIYYRGFRLARTVQ